MQAEVRIERYADQGRCVGPHRRSRGVRALRVAGRAGAASCLDEPHDREDRFWTGEVVGGAGSQSEDRVDPGMAASRVRLAMGGGVEAARISVHVSLPGQLKWKAMHRRPNR